MKLNRQSYVVFYQGKHVVRKLETLPINLVYVSRKRNYAVFYTDKNLEASIKKTLKNVKGFRNFSPSLAFNENLNVIKDEVIYNQEV